MAKQSQFDKYTVNVLHSVVAPRAILSNWMYRNVCIFVFFFYCFKHIMEHQHKYGQS